MWDKIVIFAVFKFTSNCLTFVFLYHKFFPLKQQRQQFSSFCRAQRVIIPHGVRFIIREE